VILSRGRWETITTHKLIPNATLVVTNEERAKYEHLKGDVADIVEIPASLYGMAKIRNWILDKFDEESIFMADDDLESIQVMTHEKALFIYDPAQVEQIIDNLYICAKDAGAKVYGLSINRNPACFYGNQPFKLCTWVDQGWGIIGRDLRFDEHQFVKEDIDLCLQSIMKDRIIWSDNRYAWVGKKRFNKGGLTNYRTNKNDMEDLAYLQRKWGKYLNVNRRKSVIGLGIAVRRKQPLIPNIRVK